MLSTVSFAARVVLSCLLSPLFPWDNTAPTALPLWSRGKPRGQMRTGAGENRVWWNLRSGAALRFGVPLPELRATRSEWVVLRSWNRVVSRVVSRVPEIFHEIAQFRSWEMSQLQFWPRVLQEFRWWHHLSAERKQPWKWHSDTLRHTETLLTSLFGKRSRFRVPGYRERQRFNRWRCEEGYVWLTSLLFWEALLFQMFWVQSVCSVISLGTVDFRTELSMSFLVFSETGTAILDCTLWENCVWSWEPERGEKQEDLWRHDILTFWHEMSRSVRIDEVCFESICTEMSSLMSVSPSQWPLGCLDVMNSFHARDPQPMPFSTRHGWGPVLGTSKIFEVSLEIFRDPPFWCCLWELGFASGGGSMRLWLRDEQLQQHFDTKRTYEIVPFCRGFLYFHVSSLVFLFSVLFFSFCVSFSSLLSLLVFFEFRIPLGWSDCKASWEERLVRSSASRWWPSLRAKNLRVRNSKEQWSCHISTDSLVFGCIWFKYVLIVILSSRFWLCEWPLTFLFLGHVAIALVGRDFRPRASWSTPTGCLRFVRLGPGFYRLASRISGSGSTRFKTLSVWHCNSSSSWSITSHVFGNFAILGCLWFACIPLLLCGFGFAPDHHPCCVLNCCALVHCLVQSFLVLFTEVYVSVFDCYLCCAVLLPTLLGAESADNGRTPGEHSGWIATDWGSLQFLVFDSFINDWVPIILQILDIVYVLIYPLPRTPTQCRSPHHGDVQHVFAWWVEPKRNATSVGVIGLCSPIPPLLHQHLRLLNPSPKHELRSKNGQNGIGPIGPIRRSLHQPRKRENLREVLPAKRARRKGKIWQLRDKPKPLPFELEPTPLQRPAIHHSCPPTALHPRQLLRPPGSKTIPLQRKHRVSTMDWYRPSRDNIRICPRPRKIYVKRWRKQNEHRPRPSSAPNPLCQRNCGVHRTL